MKADQKYVQYSLLLVCVCDSVVIVLLRKSQRLFCRKWKQQVYLVKYIAVGNGCILGGSTKEQVTYLMPMVVAVLMLSTVV